MRPAALLLRPSATDETVPETMRLVWRGSCEATTREARLVCSPLVERYAVRPQDVRRLVAYRYAVDLVLGVGPGWGPEGIYAGGPVDTYVELGIVGYGQAGGPFDADPAYYIVFEGTSAERRIAASLLDGHHVQSLTVMGPAA